MTSGREMKQTIEPVKEKSVEELKSMFEPFNIKIHPELDNIVYPEGMLRQASVLIPLCFKKGEYHVILTLRSDKLTHHAGYVAFPGGMMDDTDIDNVHTALREAEEEIGLKPEHVTVIGVAEPGLVKPNTLVYPVIGLVSGDYDPVINEHEVSLLFEIPLRRFLSTERRRISEFKSNLGMYNVHHFIDFVNGKEVDTWGFTATLCIFTALAVYQTDHTFCFFQDVFHNKKNLFRNTATRIIIERMQKLNSKL